MFIVLISILISDAFAIENRWVDLGDMKVFQSSENPMPVIDGAVKLEVELWEDGVLPFEFDFEVVDSQKEMFFDACREWEKVSGVRCQEGPYKERVVTVSNSNFWGCYSLWGMGSHFVVLKRQMNLADSCWRKDILMHEFGHTLGLIHEHQRMDRDQYVEIITENLASGFLWLNEKVNFEYQDSESHTDYDFFSIMHYWRKAASKNGGDTIVPRSGYEQYIDVIGRQDRLSVGDAKIAAHLYGQPRR
jgi:hypothetical protein